MLKRSEKTKAHRDRLALRYIEGNLTFTSHEAWAWFVLPTEPWAFRSDSQREQSLLGMGDALTWLAGHRLHLRVTSRPYPTAEWAAGLDRRTPNPLHTPGVPSWGEHLVDAQLHLRTLTMAEKEVYLGVRVSSRPTSHRLLSALWRHPGTIEHARLLSRIERIAEAVALPGLAGRPATSAEMEWLVRRSVGTGLPSPSELSPVDHEIWDREDLDTFSDGVECSVATLGRTVHISGQHAGVISERHVAVLSVGRVEEIEAPGAAHEPWLSHSDRLPFPVEWSCQFEVLSGTDAKRAVQRKLLVVRDMQKHFAEHDLDEPLALDRQAQQARDIEDQMTRGADVEAARIHGWFRIAVSARTEEECLERARQVVSSYRSRRVTIEHPRGQYGLLREFIPGEPVSTSAYKRRLPVLYVAAGVPTASSHLGDRRGPYVGFTAGSARRAVMFDTHYATEVRETSGLVPIVGGLGAGKSVLIGQMTYEAVRRGIPSVVLDPSGPLARLTELPELREHSRHLDLTTAASGTLNPFAVVAGPSRDLLDDEAFAEAEVLAAQDRKLLAMDIVKMLLPASVSVLADTSLVVGDAVRGTHGASTASLWDIVDNLDKAHNPHGRVVANYLRDMAELPMSRLFFPAVGDDSPKMGESLTVLTMPGLVLPPKSVPRDHWSTSEQLAVPLLHLASWYATRAVYGREMKERKLVALDETHFLGEWSAGRALFTRLGRDSRKWNTCVLAASQNPADVLGMDVANFLAAAFVGRIEDEHSARDALRMLRVPTDGGYERVLGTLSSGSGSQRPREFVLRDVDGRVDRLCVDLTANPALLAALDTTARPAEDEERVA